MSGDALRQPPANFECEYAVVAACMHNNRSVEKCGDLRPGHFADEDAGRAYGVILDGVAMGQKIDPAILRPALSDDLWGRLAHGYISQDIAHYAREIIKLAKAREGLALCQETAAELYRPDDIDKLLTQLAAGADRIAEGAGAAQDIKAGAALGAVLAGLENPAPPGIATGFRCIDVRLRRLKAGRVYVLGGRPSMGKSALALQIGVNVARAGTPVRFISLEMPAEQLAERMFALATGLPMSAIAPGISVDDAGRLIAARGALADLPLWIDEVTSQTPDQIVARTRQAKRRHGLGLVIVDHLNLMRPERDDARHGGTWATGRASNAMLHMARQCDVPVLLCVQLNRGPEGRDDPRPRLDDLRQSGEIEQDAFAVGFIYRQERYLMHEPERRANETDETFAARVADYWRRRDAAQGWADLIWAKVRDGAPGTDRLRFDAPTTSFREGEP